MTHFRVTAQPARRAPLYVSFLLLAGASLLAQAPSGTVSGSVIDSTGVRVAGAAVRIVNTQTHETHSAVTSASGDYLFPSVSTGEYNLEARANGFKSEQRAGIRLDVNQNARVDFHLQVG
ncbi:MAG: carboxypeptidase-like regulatory domain-containing protein, partial [Bryobacteraceae bacterium]